MKITKWVNDEKIDVYVSFETSETEEGKNISIRFDSTDKTWLHPEPMSKDSESLLNRYLDDLTRFLYDEVKLNGFKNGQTFGLKFNQEYINTASKYKSAL